jgi:hypothetical protein
MRIAAIPAGKGRRAEPARASYVVKAAALLRLKLTIDVACSINVRSDAPIIPRARGNAGGNFAADCRPR